MSGLRDARGILYPDALPRFHRRDVPAESGHLARWYWIAQWNLPVGEVSIQTLLPFPAANLVVEPSGSTLSGPTTSASARELTGRGWAFGVLLRPAGLVALGYAAAEIVDVEVPFSADALAAGVAECMTAGDCAAAAEVMSGWWAAQAAQTAGEGRVGREGRSPDGARQANRLLEVVESDPGLVGVDQLAREMGLSVRALQRLSKQYIGLSPLRIIRRYRLQEAALRLRENPQLTIAEVAADLGYADQSHLAADFRSTLGLAARDYRRQRQP
ncbi:helix-turn-helix domain-containing protein [Rhodococcus sp. IEGM 1408]|uniref:helix-turn-helix domain-containing protein n=1 Tax=Rhodococcus sp. IEGM 1408 TaxID=3082220 RepID=UPI002953271E|nr:helix-turn-helix domain-containing protein [Rhodococcus sp. IEGM 1408]MDV8000674.1 helix-turn-helix domain-containing protein [Rhodococcus sp. IEGM 1408]